MLARSAALALVLVIAACSSGKPLEGRVSHVRDGDTLEIGGTAIRLSGIAAPELDQPGGREARDALRRLTRSGHVRCDPTGETNSDRTIAVCRLGERDLGEAMVQLGVARDCPRYSRGRYAAAERQAGSGLARRYPLPSYCQR
ncbi:MAG: thermonuclease family protein [Alphaproteobacteria bacterium]|nr:thermonuclease family protein [Alphaproteobacteria bacterium]